MKWRAISFRKFLVWFSLFWAGFYFEAGAQEFQADVTVDASSINTSNLSVFKTLQNDLTSFINSKRWTKKVFKENERIKVIFYFVVKSYSNDKFQCELNVSVLRPVYGSGYETPLFTISDKNVQFEYQQYQPLEFNPDNLQSNLTATVAFYLYMALGYTFDSFKFNAGKEYFAQAQNIQQTAASTGMPGWEKTNDFFTKAKWVEQLLTNSNIMFHKAIYTYHRFGLDMMSGNLINGKTNLIRGIQYLTKVNRNNADFIIKLFFDTKSDEIVNVLKEGPRTSNQRNIKKILMDLAPMYSVKWEEIP